MYLLYRKRDKLKILYWERNGFCLWYKSLQIDETPVQVLNEPGRSAENKSYMWVQPGGPPDRTIVHFHYDPSRSTDVVALLLEGFEGTLMSDGYEPYRKVTAGNDIDHLCCFAHARRKFMDAKNAQPKGKSGRADAALAFIRKLYAIETECRDLSAGERLSRRHNDSQAILTSLSSGWTMLNKKWLRKTRWVKR